MPKKKTKKADSDLKEEIDKSVKMFDVAKPGKTPPSATSRPIIISHGDMIKKDPMVREQESAEPSEEAVKGKGHGETVIKPLSEKATAGEEVVAESEAKVPEEKTEEPKESEEEPEEKILEIEALETDSPVNDDAYEAGEKEDQDDDEPEKDEKAAANLEDQKQQDKLAAKIKDAENSVQSKEFFVPIGQVSRRRSKIRTLFLLMLLIIVGAACLNFAVDAGVIEIGVEPFTDVL